MTKRFYTKDIYEFFLKNLERKQDDLLTLYDYLKTVPGCVEKAGDGVDSFSYGMTLQISGYCKKMVEDALLMAIHENRMMPTQNQYLSIPLAVYKDNAKVIESELNYGVYDFRYQGFPFTRNHFVDSVLPIVGTNLQGNEDIGTCYYIGDNKFATAAHCLTGLQSFNILSSSGAPLKLKEVWFMKDRDTNEYDQAIIVIEDSVSIPSFELDDPDVLDEVLVMGYPPIPGLNPILTAETASVGAFVLDHQKGSVGEVVGEAGTYFHDLDYFLINARVKGGNSGGPVINSRGKVIGTVVGIPLDSLGGIGSGRFDVMGYGICLPSKYLRQLQSTPYIRQLILKENRYAIIES